MKFSALNRTEIIRKLKSKQYDVLVIGGGITGAGIALDAQTRGMKTALVEMEDFASGTSSRSTKLIHGGLRYLKQFEVKLVAEVGKERSIVYENGPHVTKPEWMLLPIYKGGPFGKLSTSIGLRIYDFLAGVKKSERRSMLSSKETLAKEPLIKSEGLIGGGYYVEYRTDDARLTIEVIKAAVEKEAVVSNYSKVIKFLYENEKVAGALIHDQLSDEKYEVRAKKVVNAAGPWVDKIREMDGSKSGKTIQLSKGVHLVIDKSRLPLKQAIYFDTPDGRMMFAIPRAGKAYVGTTDTFYDEDPVNPKMSVKERDYIINAINYIFPEAKIGEKDIESSWAGVRPLIFEIGKSASEISRKDEIWETKSELITIAGGKLTGYRKMAETVVDLIASKLSLEEGKEFTACQTRSLPISGGNVGGSKNLNLYLSKYVKKGEELGLSKEEAEIVARMYGSNIDTVYGLLQLNKSDAARYDLPIILFAQLCYSMEYEMVVNPIDFFQRRIGAILFDIQFVKTWKSQVLSYMADRLQWSEQDKQRSALLLEATLTAAITPVDE